MDEILIGDKTYVSSKRAAKITGYAKDYIGQLCREGRVPARLVGRSWYVLESAIQDHRFGTPAEEEGKKVLEQIKSYKTWEPPRYEAATVADDVLPVVNRLRDSNDATVSAPVDSAEHLQATWQAWFSRVGESVTPPEVSETLEEQPEPVVEITNDPESVEEEPGEVKIPIRTVYDMPPELHIRPIEPRTDEIRDKSSRSKRYPYVRTIQLVGALAALLSIVTAAAGAGFFDSNIVSSNKDSTVAGVYFYNK